MPRLEIQEPKKIYWFTNKNNQRLKKYSGDEISEQEVREFEIPEYLIKQEPKTTTRQGNL